MYIDRDICIYTCVYVYKYIYMYIYIYIHLFICIHRYIGGARVSDVPAVVRVLEDAVDLVFSKSIQKHMC